MNNVITPGSGLTPKQGLFYREYIIDLNGAQAAIRCWCQQWELPSAVCSPDKAGQNLGHADGNSTRLRDNMDKAGCSCHDSQDKWLKNSQAHHIVRKKANTKLWDDATIADYNALRNCLASSNINIDIDSAVNGVCLPKNQETTNPTDAYRHRGSGGILHSKEAMKKLKEACLDPNQTRDGMKNVLRDVAQRATNGDALFP